MDTNNTNYPATLEIDYPEKLSRVSTLLRLIYIIPIYFLFALLLHTFVHTQGEEFIVSYGGIVFLAPLLMIVCRHKYPRWWFDWNLEITRFSTRIFAYMLFLTDKYPSTDEAQSVHLNITYPDAKKDLKRWMPLVKWFLVIPHLVVLFVLMLVQILFAIIAWFAILFTGRYPRPLFDFVVGVARWSLRVSVYFMLLTTDKYPPFSLS